MKQTKIIQQVFSQIQNNQEEVIFDVLSNTWLRWVDVLEKIESVRSYFIESGIQKGDNIIIFLKNQIDFLVVLMAGISLWWVVAIVEPTMWKKVLEEKVRVLQPKYVFLEGVLYDIFTMDIFRVLETRILKNIPRNIFNTWEIVITGWISRLSKKTNKLSTIYSKKNILKLWKYTIQESDKALIVFTGGTTSNPKWVIHTHSSLFHTINEIHSIVGNYKVFYADLFHFTLLWIAFWSKVILWDEKYKTQIVQDIFSQHKVECSFFAPYKLQQFIDNDIKFPVSVACILTWSAPVYSSFLEKLYTHIWDNIQVLCLYGMTEILPIAYIEWREKLALNFEKGDILWKPLNAISCKLENKQLIVTGKHSSIQYIWKNKDDNIYTWDLVEEKNGYLIMIWRQKDMILRGNYNIYPWVYESVISSIPWIKECAMFGISESHTNESIVLLINSEKKYSKSEIYKLLEKGRYSIDTYALPQYIFFWNIPKFWRQKKIHKNKLSVIYSKEITWK